MSDAKVLWPISQAALNTEMKTLLEAVQRLQEATCDEEFLRGHIATLPASEQQFFLLQIVNELKLVAAKSATLVEVLS